MNSIRIQDQLEGKSSAPSETSIELDFDLEEEREKIRSELRKEFDQQLQAQLIESKSRENENQFRISQDNDPAVKAQDVVKQLQVVNYSQQLSYPN